MSHDHWGPPSADEVEVSLFGPGYGECVVAHLGGNRWVVVDSCLDKDTGRAAALVYLEEIGVVVHDRVEMIVCTHWHDDHIRGMASLLNACPNARFLCSSALKQSAFLELVALGETIRGPHGGGVNEFSRIFQQVKLRSGIRGPSPLETCHAGSILTRQLDSYIPLMIECLSPADADHERMSAAFVEKRDELLSTKYRQTVPSIHPNLGSIVLRLKVGEQSILLGADMETRKSPECGWNAIVSAHAHAPASDFYKIAHHGSSSGDMPEIWSNLLTPDCPAALTPNHRLANPLPRESDISRILTRTRSAFATAPAKLKRKHLQQPTERLFRHKGIEIYESPSSQGHVRARTSIHSKSNWKIQTFGRAFQLG